MTGLAIRLRSRLGPGLIFAAAAVGTSHVVQSTRAGAAFGLSLALLVLLVCALKYPLFRFAADYAAATGENLVRGYSRRGRTLVIIMFLTSAIEAVAATAGVSLVTAAIAQSLLGTQFGDSHAAIGLLGLCAILVAAGRYRLIESVTGALVVVFSVLTLIVTALSVPQLLDAPQSLISPFPLSSDNVSFAISVSGWMPIGNTAAIMLAAWVLARRAEGGGSVDATRFDFNLGYLTAVLLALCFLLIGAAVLHGRGVEMPGASAAFVNTFVGLYTQAIGDWASLLVKVLALVVMLSTMIAIVDGFPRLIAEFIAEFIAELSPRIGDGVSEAGSATGEAAAQRLYFPAMFGVLGLAGACLLFFLQNFAAFIDLMTITGFLAAPLVALANQLVITGSNVPGQYRPGRRLLQWNGLAIVALSLATLGFLYLRFS